MSDYETNFFFLLDEFAELADDAIKAERALFDYPEASCVLARRAVESLVVWLYKNDNDLYMPKGDFNLNDFLKMPSFRKKVGEMIYNKLDVIRQQGNYFAHSESGRNERYRSKIVPAQTLIEELLRVFAWFEQHYGKPDNDRKTRSFKIERIKRNTDTEQLEQILKQEQARQDELNKQLHDHQKLLDEKDAEIIALREQIAEYAAKNNARIAEHGDPNDYKESETRALLIDIMLAEAGWIMGDNLRKEVKVTDYAATASGVGAVDYVLYGDDGVPLALVEAKRTNLSVQAGKQQAKLYADSLEQQYGKRPIIFYTNGYETHLWDDMMYPPRAVQGFYTKHELNRLISQRRHQNALMSQEINADIVERHYQTRSVKSILQAFDDKRRAGLLVMATGTGKTRVAIALTDTLMRAGRVQRVLFLADRTSLVNQAFNNFKAHLPSTPIVNLLNDKNGIGRVYLSTYQTMMGLIDETNDDGVRRFGVGFFDLIIIDEAHRSVYQKFGEIFRYFDSLLIGLTATPRHEIDRDTYQLFGLAHGTPSDYYGLEEAIKDGYLVPPKAFSIDLKFVREGIKYDDLSDAEKAHWESLEWGEDGTPDEVAASAINKFLFNTDTVDKMLAHLMEYGIKVDGGDRLGKTIIFAVNQRHAEFIAERFDIQYPAYQGKFAQVITHAINHAQTLIDDFSQKDKNPQIAISVDMLDTGIDVPEVVNLVFFKAVRSKVKFMQMIGRGTRLCKDLFAPNQDKQEFFIFDYCQNFEYFNENPNGATVSQAEPLGKRLFKTKANILYRLAQLNIDEPLRQSLLGELHNEVRLMNHQNFIVRPHWQTVTHFQNLDNWQALDDNSMERLESIAGLPTDASDSSHISAKLFDLLCYQLQLALLQGDAGHIATAKKKIEEIAAALSLKENIPVIRQHIALIHELIGDEFWQTVGIADIERVRVSLRELIRLLDKTTTPIIYTTLDDEIGEMQEVTVHSGDVGVDVDKYKKRVADFIRANEDHITIAKLRRGIALTPTDLEQLQKFVYNAQEVAGEQEFISHFGTDISLPEFIRSLVGLDYQAVKQKFSEYLLGTRYNERQIRFVEMIIDELTKNGKLKESRLYEAPFSQIHSGGIDDLFKDDDVDHIFHLIKDFNATMVV